MALKIVSLASGSKGNATLIYSDKTALLLDAGICLSRIADGLAEFGVSLSDLDGVIVTHEHEDHIRALPQLSKYTKIYAHPLTAQAIAARQGGIFNVASVTDFEGGFCVGDINVLPFRIPHDAAYPLAFSFKAGEARCSVATDIGVATRGLMRNIADSDLVLLEANHDVDMLMKGNYPPRLKSRILSNNGHLSNGASALVASLLAKDGRATRLILGHISENNNTEALAYETVKAALDAAGNTRMELHLAHQGRRSEIFEL